MGSNVQYFGNFHYTKSNYPQSLEAIKFFGLFRNPFAHPSVSFRRKLDLLYNSEYDGVEDYELWVRCLNNPSIKALNIKEVLTKYRIHKKQSSKHRDIIKIEEMRGKLSKTMCQKMNIPIEAQKIFIALSVEKNLNFEDAYIISNLLKINHNISKDDRLIILKEIILSTNKLNIKQATTLLKLFRNDLSNFFYTIRSLVILLLSSGPLSLLARTIRITWG